MLAPSLVCWSESEEVSATDCVSGAVPVSAEPFLCPACVSQKQQAVI